MMTIRSSTISTDPRPGLLERPPAATTPPTPAPTGSTWTSDQTLLLSLSMPPLSTGDDKRKTLFIVKRKFNF